MFEALRLDSSDDRSVSSLLKARLLKEINNHACTVYYSVVGLKICTLHCNIICVKLYFFLPQFHAHGVIFGPSCSSPAFSCPAFSCPANWSVIFTSSIFTQPIMSYEFQIWQIYSEGPYEQKPIKNLRETGAWAYTGTAHIFGVPPIISGMDKATNFKFGRYIHRVHPNKSPLKI